VNRDPAPAFPRGPFVEPRRPRPYPPIFVREASVPVKVTVVGYGQERGVLFMVVELAGQPTSVTLLANGLSLYRFDNPTPKFTLVAPSKAAPGIYSLRVLAERGDEADITVKERLVTVLAVPVEPEPEPDRPAGTIQSAHETYLRVRPDGVVDFGGMGKGPWEQISVETRT
jgi:hypothetical protein